MILEHLQKYNGQLVTIRLRSVWEVPYITKHSQSKPLKPNRLKIVLGVKDSIITVGKDNEVTLQSMWLHGAPSPGLKYNVKGRITPVATIFTGYRSFDFDDRTKNTGVKEMVLSEGSLDENGEVKFNPNLALNNEVRGSLKVDLMAKIFEKGGNFSQDYGTFRVKAYQSYVGIESPKVNEQDNSLVTDKKHTFRLVNVTDKGQPITGKKLQVKIYKIDWNWWWDNDGELSDLYAVEQFVSRFRYSGNNRR